MVPHSMDTKMSSTLQYKDNLVAPSPAELFTAAFTAEEFCPALAADPRNSTFKNPTLKKVSVLFFAPA
jgi:hypothetical protein